MKKLLLACILMLAVLFMVGCGNNNTGAAPEVKPTVSSESEVSVEPEEEVVNSNDSSSSNPINDGYDIVFDDYWTIVDGQACFDIEALLADCDIEMHSLYTDKVPGSTGTQIWFTFQKFGKKCCVSIFLTEGRGIIISYGYDVISEGMEDYSNTYDFRCTGIATGGHSIPIHHAAITDKALTTNILGVNVPTSELAPSLRVLQNVLTQNSRNPFEGIDEFDFVSYPGEGIK